MHDDDLPSPTQRFRCPGCGEDVDVASESAGQLVRCPYCNTDFFASDELADSEVVDDTVEPIDDSADRLNAARVRHYSTLRRATIKARSWCQIGAVLSLMVCLDWLGEAVVDVTVWRRWDAWATVYVLGSIAAGFVSWLALKKGRELLVEIERSAIVETGTPPDFTNLGTNPAAWRRLEEIGQGTGLE